ncbi:unnamed protein product [Prorocentrum cordatum]|uniref:Uncharacterized protein n=1 Tax=Prorocentrum cordatum TaxID=2364126 RepID=A0ABN9XIQ5_9DINO|nr:unnamed protein product [Polarella glacialis]
MLQCASHNWWTCAPARNRKQFAKLSPASLCMHEEEEEEGGGGGRRRRERSVAFAGADFARSPHRRLNDAHVYTRRSRRKTVCARGGSAGCCLNSTRGWSECCFRLCAALAQPVGSCTISSAAVPCAPACPVRQAGAHASPNVRLRWHFSQYSRGVVDLRNPK